MPPMVNIRTVGDRFEGRLARAIVRATERMRERVSINELAAAIGAKDVRRALALIPEENLADALQPVAAIVRATEARGERMGAER